MITPDTIMVTACCLALVYGAIHDLATRTIPNALSMCVGMVGVVHAIRAQNVIDTLIVTAAVFLLGACAWRALLLGGGDVKLLTAASLWIKPSWEPAFLVTIAIAGGLLGCLYLVLSAVVRSWPGPKPQTFARRVIRAEIYRVQRRASIPYAVAIAAATIICLVKQ